MDARSHADEERERQHRQPEIRASMSSLPRENPQLSYPLEDRGRRLLPADRDVGGHIDLRLAGLPVGPADAHGRREHVDHALALNGTQANAFRIESTPCGVIL